MLGIVPHYREGKLHAGHCPAPLRMKADCSALRAPAVAAGIHKLWYASIPQLVSAVRGFQCKKHPVSHDPVLTCLFPTLLHGKAATAEGNASILTYDRGNKFPAAPPCLPMDAIHSG